MTERSVTTCRLRPPRRLAGQIQLANFRILPGSTVLERISICPQTPPGSRWSATRAGRKVWAVFCRATLKHSNVNVVEEFVNLIVSQRAYEANSRVVRAADEMYQQINQLTR